MKVLLLGGTGAIGERVAKECVHLGYEVYVTSRKQRASNEIQYIQGNALDDTFIEQLLESQSFDAILDFMVYRTSVFSHRIEHLLASTKHYIFVSSYRVFSDSEYTITEKSDRLLDVVNDPQYLLTDEYALAKARQENILNELKSKFSNWTIVRPSITYGGSRLQFGNLESNTFLTRAKQGLTVPIPTELMSKYTTLTWAGDVAYLLSRLVLNDKAYGNDFNLGSDEFHTWGQIGEIYTKIINLKLMQVDDVVYSSLGLNKYQLKYDRLYNRKMDPSKVLSAINENSFIFKKVAVGLEEEISKLKVLPDGSYTRIHARMDRIVGKTRVIKAIKSNTFFSYLIGLSSLANKLYLIKRDRKLYPKYISK